MKGRVMWESRKAVTFFCTKGTVLKLSFWGRYVIACYERGSS